MFRSKQVKALEDALYYLSGIKESEHISDKLAWRIRYEKAKADAARFECLADIEEGIQCAA